MASIHYAVSGFPEEFRPAVVRVLRSTVPVKFSPMAYKLQRDDEYPDFRCVHCGGRTRHEDGGADLLPEGCSKCWVKADEALDAAGLQQVGE